MSEAMFTVPIIPIGKARARVTSRGTFTPTKTRKAEAVIAGTAKATMGAMKPATGRVVACVTAYMPIPASWSKRRREDAKASVIRPTSRPDADNISKLVLDACNGIVYADDAQVVDLRVLKFYGDSPGIAVEFRWSE